MATQRTVELLKKSAVDTTLAKAIDNKLGEILYTPAGDFCTEFTITKRNEVGYDVTTKTFWLWLGELPKTVLSTDEPNTTDWKDVTQATLSALLIDQAESGNRVARMPITADSLKDLVNAPKIDGRQYSVKQFGDPNDDPVWPYGSGGGLFIWDASRDKTQHNGGTIIDPDRIGAWDGTQADLATLFTAAVSGVGCFVRVYDESIGLNSFWFGSFVSASGLSNLSIQAALDCLEQDAGGVINIERGVKFKLSELSLPKRSTLKYFADSDVSRVSYHVMGTNELIIFQANANDGGIVNEDVLSASFHPGVVIDVQKNITGHDPFLGPGQHKSYPARASYNIRDEGILRYRFVYQSHDEPSIFQGVIHDYTYQRINITGVGSDSFLSAPEKDDIITGESSGATGLLWEISATGMVVNWISGKFIVGEKLICNKGTRAVPVNETSSDIVATAVRSGQRSHGLAVGGDNGYWGVGLPNSSAKSPFSVGGRIGITPTRNMGQYIPEYIDSPTLEFAESYDAETTNGKQLVYDTSGNVDDRRLHLRSIGDSNNFGFVGGVKASTNFANTVLKAASSYNIDTIVRNGLGDYTITFLTPFVRADYQVAFSTSNPTDTPYVFAKTTTTLRIKNGTSGTATPQDLNGVLGVIVTGGDI